MNTGTIIIFVVILGGGLALYRAINKLPKETRHDSLAPPRLDPLHNRILTMEDRLDSRIDNLYQALFSHKDPAA